MYYLFDNTTTRCFGTADGLPAPMDGVTIYHSDTVIDNFYDYVLIDGVMTYQPEEKVKA